MTVYHHNFNKYELLRLIRRMFTQRANLDRGLVAEQTPVIKTRSANV